MSKNIPVARKNGIVVQELGNEILIYDLKTDKALSLNKTSALIWQLTTGEQTISEIAKAASHELKTNVGEDFVWLALAQLKKEDLIENEIDIPNQYQGASRREIIKKIGFASLITLPVISFIIAPTAAQATSGNSCSATANPPGCSCVTEATCQSNCCGGMVPPVCMASRGSAIGTPCRNSCECVTNLCGFGRLCAADKSVPNGGNCRSNRECVSDFCFGTCLARSGEPCTNNAQCISNVCLGNNTCQ